MKPSLGLLFAFCTLGAQWAPAQVQPVVLVRSANGVSERVYPYWTAFVHPRFGYELPVPPEVRAVGVPEAATETKFVSPDGSFVMSAWGGLSRQSPTSLIEAQWTLAQRKPGRTVTYQRKGRSWFVVSGTDKSGTEFYEKFITSGERVAACSLTYPRSRLREFEPWVEEIEDGFRVVTLPHGPPEIAPLLYHGRAPSLGGTLDIEDLSREEIPHPPLSGAPLSANRPAPPPPAIAKSRVDLTPPPKRPDADFAPTKLEDRKPVVSNTVKSPPDKQPEAAVTAAAPELPIGQKVVGRPGFVYSPFHAAKSLVDVVDIPAGTKVKCPYTGKHFRVP